MNTFTTFRNEGWEGLFVSSLTIAYVIWMLVKEDTV